MNYLILFISLVNSCAAYSQVVPIDIYREIGQFYDQHSEKRWQERGFELGYQFVQADDAENSVYLNIETGTVSKTLLDTVIVLPRTLDKKTGHSFLYGLKQRTVERQRNGSSKGIFYDFQYDEMGFLVGSEQKLGKQKTVNKFIYDEKHQPLRIDSQVNGVKIPSAKYSVDCNNKTITIETNQAKRIYYAFCPVKSFYTQVGPLLYSKSSTEDIKGRCIASGSDISCSYSMSQLAESNLYQIDYRVYKLRLMYQSQEVLSVMYLAPLYEKLPLFSRWNETAKYQYNDQGQEISYEFKGSELWDKRTTTYTKSMHSTQFSAYDFIQDIWSRIYTKTVDHDVPHYPMWLHNPPSEIGFVHPKANHKVLCSYAKFSFC